MQTFGLFVDLDSLSEALESLRLPVDHEYIARGLKENAEALGELTCKQVSGAWASGAEQPTEEEASRPDARTAFARQGYDFGLPGIDELAEHLDDLIVDGRCPDVVVVATGVGDSKRLIRTAERLRKTQRSLVLWYTENATGSEMLEHASQSHPIQALLDLHVVEAALLVDLERVIDGLREHDRPIDYALLARALRKRAEAGGRLLTEAHAFADFDRLPDLPASGGRPISCMIAFSNERFVIHNAPDAGVEGAAAAIADEGSRLRALPSPPGVLVIAGADSRELGGKAEIVDPRELLSSAEPAAGASHGRESRTESGMGPGPLLTIPLKLALILESGGLAWVPFRRLMQELTTEPALFAGQELAKEAINAAISEGILLKSNIPNPRVPGTTTSALEPNREHPMTQAALSIATRIVRLLEEMQGRFPFVAFSYFNRSLTGDPTICELALSELECRDWLNHLVRENAIIVSKEDNPVNPQFKVSTLKLNPSHPMARMALQPGSTPTDEMRMHVILTLDHYLTRKGTPWMPMSTLRTKLEHFGRMVMEQALSELQQEGAIITEKYDNPQKEFKTTGCYLRPESPQVATMLQARGELLGTLQDLLRRYPAVPANVLEERVIALNSVTASGVEGSKWLEALADEGLVKLHRSNGDSAVAYVLADSDPVTRKALPPEEIRPLAATPVDGDSAWLAALAEVHSRHNATA